MAVGLAASVAQGFLDAMLNSVAYDGPTNIYAQLHIGDPGVAGTANPAVETTRQEVTFGPASGGACANDAVLTWTNVAGTEDYTHVTLWDALSGGVFQGSGTITANPMTAGNTFAIPIGDVDVVINTAS